MRARVLVIDDEPKNGRAIARAIGGEHDVVIVDRAREALAKIRDGERFDVILCDLVMPEMTGTHLLAELRASYPSKPARSSS
jgi:CheY-like chemotaxis protein